MSDQQIKPFAAFLTTTNKGKTHAELSERLHELIGKVLDTGKSGAITLTVKVAAEDADARRLTVTETISVKLPQPDARKSLFFADPTGNLTRQDPLQMSFDDSPVRGVPSETPSTATGTDH